MKPEPLPCLFCGGKRGKAMLEEIHEESGGGWRVSCYGCMVGTWTGAFKTKAEVLAIWNDRAALTGSASRKET